MKDGVKFTITPDQDWHWGASKKAKEARSFAVKLDAKKTADTLNQDNGEGMLKLVLKVVRVRVCVVVQPYIGLDRIREDGVIKSTIAVAKILVQSYKDEPVTVSSCRWTLPAATGHCKINDPRDQSTLSIEATRPSNAEGQEVVQAEVTIESQEPYFRGKKFKGKGSFTIVAVDVKLADVGEDKEDRHDAVLLQHDDGSNSAIPVEFACTPMSLQGAAGKVRISVNGGVFCRQTKYKDGGVWKTKCDPLGAGEYSIKEICGTGKGIYVLPQGARKGDAQIVHPLSTAIDIARFACWSFEFITPRGSPVTEPLEKGEGRNEFCYNDESGQCKIELCVGIVPAGVQPFTVEKAKSVFSGRFTVSKINDKNNVSVKWDEGSGGQNGKWKIDDKGRIVCSTMAIYDRMPQSNDSFGMKKASYVFGAKQRTANFEIFFRKYGSGHPKTDVDGMLVPGPNWFYYWRQGAVTLLSNTHMIFDSQLKHNRAGEFRPLGSKWEIAFSDLAAQRSCGEFVINKALRIGTRISAVSLNSVPVVQSTSVSDSLIVGKKGLTGIAAAATVAQHELRHKDSWDDLMRAPTNDKDGDGMRHTLKNGLFTSDGEAEAIQNGINTYWDMPDSYSFATAEDNFREYSAYGDNEIRARAAEKEEGFVPAKDWAWPGCNTRKVCGPKNNDFDKINMRDLEVDYGK